MKITSIIVAIIFMSLHTLNGQAWVQKKGNSYSQIAFTSVVGESKYNNDGEPLDLVRKLSDQTLQLYHQHGLNDKLTLTANIPIKFVSTGDDIISPGFSGNMLPAGNLTSLGNISLSAIYGIKQDARWVYAVQLRTDFNTSAQSESTGLRTGVDAFGIAPSFHVGHGTNAYWLSLDAGTNIRTKNYSTQWFSNFQIGTKIGKSFSIIGQLGTLQSLEDGDAPDGNAIETGLYTNNLEFTAYSLKLGFDFKPNFSLMGTIGGGVSGHDVTRAPAFTLSVSYKRNKE